MNGQVFYERTASAIAGYLRQEINIQAGVHYRFVEATSGPRVLALMIIVNPRYASKITALSEQMSMAAGLDRGQSIRVARGRQGMLALEVPKPRELWYSVPVSALPRRRFLLASVGFTGEFHPAAVDFASPLTPHCLVAGTTGSGKTNVQRLIIYDLAAQNAPDAVQFILIDTRKRGSAWAPFAGLPHLLHPIITDDATAGRALSWAVAEIDRRAREHRDRPRVFIGIDEAQALLEQEALARDITDIAGTGREFGIHVIAATQNPTAKQLGDMTLKRNLSARLVGKVDDATAAHVATGQEDTGAHRLTGAGDMLLVTPEETWRITAALVTDDDTARLPRAAAVGALDLDSYEDSDHVADVADLPGKAGRRPDPLDFYLVGRLLAHLARTPHLSDGSLGNKLGIHSGKITRHREVAGEVLRGLRDEIAVVTK
jgi:S-DNA-T family DNA segregation ATPase FtsK/SpoIIIE